MPDRYAVEQDGEIHVLRDHQARAEAHIVPSKGNNVVRFRVAPGGPSGPVDVFITPDEGGLGPSGYRAGNPILFPFPNRVKGGHYVFEGRELQFDVNETARGNHIHGLVSSRPWQVDGSGTSPNAGAWLAASISLGADADAKRQFPFPCTLTVTTRLRDGVLEQEIAVRNTGDGSLPMGFGTHPWFHATLEGERREAAQVRVPGNRYWELENLLPTGRTIPVTQVPDKYDLRDWHQLSEDEYDDVFTDLVRRDDGWSAAGIRYENVGLELVVEASPEFREWVIYAPKDRSVVCLEPYTCTTNAVNLQRQGIDAGLIVLPAGDTWTGVIKTFLRKS
jgi:aldose 1-epimerase